jgi:hypothetical protein
LNQKYFKYTIKIKLHQSIRLYFDFLLLLGRFAYSLHSPVLVLKCT